MRRAIACVLLAATLSATGAHAAPEAPGGPPADAYADFVLGRFAQGERDLEEARDRYARALLEDPDSLPLRRRAFTQALAAGDERAALEQAPALRIADPLNPQLALFDLAQAVKRKRWDAAQDAATRLGGGGLGAIASPITRAWIAQGAGRGDEALSLLSPNLSTGLARSYLAEHRARVLSAEDRWSLAAEAWTLALAEDAPASWRLRASDAMLRAGDPESATAVLAGQEGLGAFDPVRARAARGRTSGLAPDTAATGIATLLARLAQDIARRGGTTDALALVQVAGLLASQAEEVALLRADLLAAAGQRPAALAALASVRRSSPLAGDAAAQRASVLEATGDQAGARAAHEAATRRSDASANAWLRRAEFHRRAGEQLAAADAYARVLALSEAGARNNWTLHFLRGGALEQAGQWSEAEAALRAALALAPEEPLVLNYLGYAMLDRDQNLDEADALIRKAAARAPNSAAITDSLGWLLFKRGRAEEAVPVLERALRGAPGDPTINEHVGDAYWAVGRRIEARHRWEAARVAGPDAVAQARLAAKLAGDPDAMRAMASAGARTTPTPPPAPPRP
jgi:tetratricopeptide (TPR) repeat protein